MVRVRDIQVGDRVGIKNFRGRVHAITMMSHAQETGVRVVALDAKPTDPVFALGLDDEVELLKRSPWNEAH